MSKTADLQPSDFPSLQWQDAPSDEDLNRVYEYVTARASQAIKWYYDKRKKKRFYGFSLRYAAIFFTAVGGVYPVMTTIFQGNGSGGTHLFLNPAWSTVAIALAALMIAIDKLGGFTSGWVRYILASQSIDREVEHFRFSWELEKTHLDTGVDKETALRLISLCRDFMLKVNGIITNETESWVSEFQTALKQVDQAAKAAAKIKSKAAETGAINVEVENGAQSADGWQLRVGGGPEQLFKGKRGAVAGLKPGIVTVEVVGAIDGKEVQDNRTAQVQGGKSTAVYMKLN